MPLPGRGGLANTHVVPAGWEDHHRPVSDDAMPAECTITRQPSTTTAWDDTAGRSVLVAPTTMYEGPCRFHRGGPANGSDAAGATVADRQMALGQYVVTVPTGADLVQVNDTITITACTGDPDAVGIPLQVLGSRRSALTWERTISCQMQQPVTR